MSVLFMKYKDLLNKEDYNTVSIFEFPKNGFCCTICGELFDDSKRYRLNSYWCKDCYKFERKLHHLRNPEYAVARDKEWQKNNRQKVNSHRVKRRKSDPLFNLKERLVQRIHNGLKYKSWKKPDSLTNSIGCDAQYLCNHIESMFQPGMNWDNRSLWHIDHIVPLSSAKTPEEMLKLNHYTNLQPLWASDNLKKSNK
jgi:ribosome-binding protein aMBF1 (putative translation factor)